MTNLNSSMGRYLRDRHGGAAVEMALVFPFLCLMILGAIDAGWMLWSASTLDFAVEEAARCGAVDATNCGTTANIQGVAVDKAMGLGMSASDFTVTTPACGKKVAEGGGFEPPVRFDPYDSLANCWFKPLTHLSNA